MVRILAFDTASDSCSVALLDPERAFLQESKVPRVHAKSLLPMIDSLLREGKIELSDLNMIVCGVGPGSFTGIRIGVAVAQGLGFGQELPVMGIPTLEAMAHRLWRQEKVQRVLVLLDARMQQFFAATYTIIKHGHLIVERASTLISVDELPEWTTDIEAVACTGGALLDLDLQLPIFTSLPQALDLAYLARVRFDPSKQYLAEELTPLYVREEVAKPAQAIK
jgi:tRNA threonylcarbamoyladenosine biosynthesis protein TsaB